MFLPFSYVCGEHEFGGLPWWLLRDVNNIEFRQMNPGWLTSLLLIQTTDSPVLPLSSLHERSDSLDECASPVSSTTSVQQWRTCDIRAGESHTEVGLLWQTRAWF